MRWDTTSFRYTVFIILYCIFPMKDLVVKIITFLIGAALIAYTGWLWIGNLPVTSGLIHVSKIALIICAIVGFLLIIAAMRPALLPQNRWSIAVVGIIIIMLAHSQLSDDPSRYIFLKDVMKVIGVYLIIVWPMKLLIPKKIQEEVAQKDVEIIEV